VRWKKFPLVLSSKPNWSTAFDLNFIFLFTGPLS
jgi:hypothetical protein